MGASLLENLRAATESLLPFAQPPSSAHNRPQGGGFDSFFAAANNGQAERASAAQPQRQQEDRPSRVTQAERPAQRLENNPRSESEQRQSHTTVHERAGVEQRPPRPADSEPTAENTAEAAPPEQALEQNLAEYANAQVEQTAFVYDLAHALGIEPAALEVIMYEKGITKEALADPAARATLLTAVFGLEHEVELLNVKDAVQLHTKITELLAKHSEVHTVVKAAAPQVLPQMTAYAAQTADVELTAHAPQTSAEAPVQAEAAPQTGTGTGKEQPKQHGEFMPHTVQTTAPAEQPKLEMVQQSDGTFVVTETTTNQSARVISVSSRPAPVQVNALDIIKQLADNMRFDIRGANISEIRLTLRPENLGDVTMRISSENGIVMASFVAENARVKEAIEANMNQLRQALEEKGIEISELSVSVESEADERMKQFLQQQAAVSGRMREITEGLDGEESAMDEEAERLQGLDSTVEFSA
ncbi:MAG: flagellar hook-length control protein FliK [Defluviitaleaceae bacterium]|nr:flagellar hook-length control protein FliK [Defluviitaleaceae bacterium]